MSEEDLLDKNLDKALDSGSEKAFGPAYVEAHECELAPISEQEK